MVDFCQKYHRNDSKKLENFIFQLNSTLEYINVYSDNQTVFLLPNRLTKWWIFYWIKKPYIVIIYYTERPTQ